jgi:predicted amidohydrolase YtcJ
MNSFASIIIKNGQIYTSNEKRPWADVMAIKDDKFLYVGKESDGEWENYIGPDSEIKTLKGELVLPGLIDGHVHPVTIAKSGWYISLPETDDVYEILEFVKTYCEEHPKEDVPYFFGVSYPTTMFGEEGPKKELLDRYVSDRPVRLQDFSDHSCWYNSKALNLMEIEEGKSDPEGITFFIRNNDGEPTGWAMEPVQNGSFESKMYEKLNWYPPTEVTEEMVKPFLDFLKSKGVCAIMDGITEGESSMKLFYDMDKAGRLNMYYSAACILETYEVLDEVIGTIRDWQKKYITPNIIINTVKFFLDNTNEFGTCASLYPFSNDQTGENFGKLNMGVDQLAEVMVRLNREGIDLHIHVVGDRGFRTACDAVEKAKNVCKEGWKIYVQLAHCEIIDPSDMERPAELGIIINWTPHWAAGFFGTEARDYLGEERFNRMYDFTKIIKSGAIVTYSSDVIGQQEAHRGDPYFGMECAHTRIDVENPIVGGIRKPESARLSLEELIKGYTIHGAIPFRMKNRIGSIEVGKEAHFAILNKNLFEVSPDEIHTVKPVEVYFKGKAIKI